MSVAMTLSSAVFWSSKNSRISLLKPYFTTLSGVTTSSIRMAFLNSYSTTSSQCLCRPTPKIISALSSSLIEKILIAILKANPTKASLTQFNSFTLVKIWMGSFYSSSRTTKPISSSNDTSKLGSSKGRLGPKWLHCKKPQHSYLLTSRIILS